jgi:dTMP kinase
MSDAAGVHHERRDDAHRGLFITLEGIDGAGKSSHLEWLAQRWQAIGHSVVLTREPGGSALGEKLRELLLHTPMTQETELLLMFAARSEHLVQRIIPALRQGHVVICDRFTDSTFAYQGFGRGLDIAWIETLEARIVGPRRPDRTYLFDVPARVAAGRRAAVRVADRFEAEDLAFFDRVREGYRVRAQSDAERFLSIDGQCTLEEIRRIIEADIASLSEKLQNT